MATFKIRLSLLHAELPGLISLITHLFFVSSQGFRKGVARSNRKIKNDTSTLKPTPAPTASSLTKLENENGFPSVEGFDFNSHTFPASANMAPFKNR